MHAVVSGQSNEARVAGCPAQRKVSILAKRGRDARSEPKPRSTIRQTATSNPLSGAIDSKIHRANRRLAQHPLADATWLDHIIFPQRTSDDVKLLP